MKPPGRSASKFRSNPRVEPLEFRQLLATLLVTSASPTGSGSLAAAIVASNGDVGQTNTIDFDILGGGVQTINVVANPLPTITNPVVIDATTQPGFVANSEVDVDNAQLMIVLNGSAATQGSSGLNFASGASRSALKGFDIKGFGGDAIDVEASQVTISGNFIGVEPYGRISASSPNGGNGVTLRAGSSGNLVGGPALADRNIITFNSGSGISIDASSANQVAGNFIGVEKDGGTTETPDTYLGNRDDGVLILSGSNNTIGGTASGDGNVISGNKGVGEMNGGYTEGNVQITGSGADDNVVQQDIIGLDSTGTVGLLNYFGVSIEGGAGNTVGGTVPAASNLIANNFNSGVTIQGTGPNLVAGDDITRNLRGVFLDDAQATISGVTVQANTNTGIQIDQSNGVVVSSSTIGGTTASQGNGFEGIVEMGSVGVLLQDDDVSNNASSGIQVNAGSNNTTITGTTIADNGYDGIDTNESTGLRMIGLSIAGNLDIGLRVLDGTTGASLTASTIGGSSASQANGVYGGVGLSILNANDVTINGVTVESNLGFGILIESAEDTSLTDLTVSGTRLTGDNLGDGIRVDNSNGVTLSHVSSIGNAGIGVNISKSPYPNLTNATIQGNTGGGVCVVHSFAATITSSTIGGVGLAQGNAIVGILVSNCGQPSLQQDMIAGNQGPGVWINDNSNLGQVDDCLIASNFDSGLVAVDAQNTSLGGDTIRSNEGDGVLLFDDGGVLINTSTIGGSPSSLRNLGDGVAVIGSSNVTVGGPTSSSNNLISGNSGAGFEFVDSLDGVVDEDTIINNAGNGVNALGSIGLSVVDSSILYQEGYGVSIADGSNNATLKGNTISGNIRAGVYVVSSTGLSDND